MPLKFGHDMLDALGCENEDLNESISHSAQAIDLSFALPIQFALKVIIVFLVLMGALFSCSQRPHMAARFCFHLLLGFGFRVLQKSLL